MRSSCLTSALCTPQEPTSSLLPPAPPSSGASSTKSNNSSKRHASSGKKAGRKRRRESQKVLNALEYSVPRVSAKRHAEVVGEIPTSIEMESMPVSSSGFVGQREKEEEEETEGVCLNELLDNTGGYRFMLIKYDPR